MSFRDLRCFTEVMRSLGYSRLISMEHFRTANFPLVADILIWLARRFDSDPEIETSFQTEEDRILLIRSIAQFMALKVNVILNTKRLYQADGYAVKEMLKITSVLSEALRLNAESARSSAKRSAISSQDFGDLSSRIQDLRLSRELASQVTKKGAALYELLGKEVELRELRNASVSSQVELGAAESALEEALNATKESIAATKALIENISQTEASLDAKIEKRQAELERNQKRLQTLKKVRPGFLEEFEKLEVELQGLYEEYVTKARIVAYLEVQQEEAQQAEQLRIINKQRETRKLMEEMEEEESRKLMEEEETEDLGLSEEVVEKEIAAPALQQRSQLRQARLRTASAARPRIGTGRKRVFGGMTTGGDTGSDESDSDLLLDYDDDDRDDLDDDDDIDDDLLPSNRSDSDHQQPPTVTSDDDF